MIPAAVRIFVCTEFIDMRPSLINNLSGNSGKLHSPLVSRFSVQAQYVRLCGLIPSSAANSAVVRPLSRQRSTRFAHSSRDTRVRFCTGSSMHAKLATERRAWSRGWPNAYARSNRDEDATRCVRLVSSVRRKTTAKRHRRVRKEPPVRVP